MSGGIPRIATGAGDTRSKKDKDTRSLDEIERTKEEDMAQRRLVQATAADRQASRDAASLVPPDIADVALRDASSGKVRRVRAGSTRDSLLGSAMQYVALLGIVGWAWLRAALRGDIW